MLTDEPEAIDITELLCQRKTVSFMVNFSVRLTRTLVRSSLFSIMIRKDC